MDPPDCRIEFVCGTGAVTNSSRPPGRWRGSPIQMAVKRQAAGEGITFAQHLVSLLAANLSTLGLRDRLGVQWHRCASINLKRAGAGITWPVLLVPADRRVARQLQRRLSIGRRLPWPRSPRCRHVWRWTPPWKRAGPHAGCLKAPADIDPDAGLGSAWGSVVAPVYSHHILGNLPLQNWLQFACQYQITIPWRPRTPFSIRQRAEDCDSPRLLAAPENQGGPCAMPVCQAPSAYGPNQIPSLWLDLSFIDQAESTWRAIRVFPVWMEVPRHAVESRCANKRWAVSRHAA